MSSIDEAQSNKEVIKNFATETTMHGLKFLYSRGIVRNVIWLMLLVGSCGLIYMQMYQQFVKYLSKEVSTQIDLDYPASVTLPPIMLCNSNMYRISKVFNYNQMYEMLMDVYRNKETKESRFVSPFTTGNYSAIMSNLSSTFNNASVFAQAFGHNMIDMILNCINPDGTICDWTNFRLQMTDIGPCFVYNSTVPILQPAYVDTKLKTFQVLIYDNNDYPSPSMNAIDIAPGYMSVISLKQHKEERITSCTSPIATKHFAESQYSSVTCKLDLLYSGIEDTCKCSPHYAPKISNVSTCSIKNFFNCVLFYDTTNVTNKYADCQESCSTKGYSTSLALAKISTVVQKELQTRTQLSMQTDFALASEATTRKDPNYVQSMYMLISDWRNASKKMASFGLWVDPSSDFANYTLSKNLQLYSSTYNAFYLNFSALIEVVPQNTNNDPGQDSTGCRLPGVTGAPVTTVVANSTNTSQLVGYNSVMSSKQQSVFEQDPSKNINTTVYVYNAWLNWASILSNPCTIQFPMPLSQYPYIPDMLDDIKSYYEIKNLTKYQWAANSVKYSSFPDDYGSICSSYLYTTNDFISALQSLKNDTMLQEIFQHLDDADIENSQFWLSVNLATSAKFSFVTNENCTPNNKQQTAANNQQVTPNNQQMTANNQQMTTNTIANCLSSTNSPSCSSCISSLSQTAGMSGSSAPSECCTMKIQPNNTYYWSLFKFLKENLDKLINESQAFLTSSQDICDNVTTSYFNINNDLTTYFNTFVWGTDFYAANFLGLQIYFNDLSQQTITQTQPYDFFSLICDIGGTLGLFLGASILTFFEIIDMIIFGICRHMRTNQVK